MRVVALFRVSTEKQASEGASLDAQERRYRELAKREGWLTVEEFRGHESATQAASDRRVLQQVLGCIRDRDVDAVYVHEQSRLTRGDELEVAMLMRELKERRIKIIVNGVVRDLASIDERFMVGIQSLVDRAESERIKERLGRGKNEKARQGKKTGGPAPYGYMNPPPGMEGRGRLQVVPAEAAVVRKAFEVAASGKGVLAVAGRLNELGYPAPKGGAWGKTSITRLLQNPAYIGVSASRVWVAEPGSRNFRFEMSNPNAIIVENAHDPIITRELWDSVHGRPRLPRTIVPRLLTGLLYVDDKPFSGDTDGARRFYRGPRGSRGHAWIESEYADEVVWNNFTSLATAPEFVAQLMKEVLSPRERESLHAEIRHVQDQIARHEKRLERLLEMRADGEIDKAVFATKSAQTNAELDQLRSKAADLRSKVAVMDGTHAVRVVRAVQALLAGRTKLTCEQKRSILLSIVRRIDVQAERTKLPQTRGEGGRLGPASGRTWAIRNVSFTLALPRNAGGATTAHDATGGAEAATVGDSGRARMSATSGNGAGHGSGQLATTPFGCDQLPGTEMDGGTGQLVTIP